MASQQFVGIIAAGAAAGGTAAPAAAAAPGAETFEGVCRKVELRLDELHDMLAPYSRAMQPVKTRHSGFFDIGHWRGLGQAKKVQ